MIITTASDSTTLPPHYRTFKTGKRTGRDTETESVEEEEDDDDEAEEVKWGTKEGDVDINASLRVI